MTRHSISPLRQRMIEDMNSRQLSAGTQKGHLRSCRRFAAFLKRSPDTASPEDIRRFQLHLAQSGVSISNRNRTMTGLRFLFRVTLRRLDLAAEIHHIREPQKIPLVISTDEAKRLLAVAKNLKVRVLLSLAYGCGLRAGEIVRLRAGDTLLLETNPAFVDAQRYSRDFFLVSRVENSSPLRHERAWVARLLLIGMVVLVVTEATSMFKAACLTGAAMVLTRCLRASQVKRAMDWGVLVGIGAGIGIGKALQASGAIGSCQVHFRTESRRGKDHGVLQQFCRTG